MFADEGAEQFSARGIIEHQDFDAELGQPVVATDEVRGFTDHHGANVELTD